MTEQVIVEEQTTEEKVNIIQAAQETAQKALHLGIGAADAAREEITSLLEKAQKDVSEILEGFISRGENLGAEGRKRVEETVETNLKQADENVTNIRGEFEKRVESILHRMNVPTKADIDALSKKISTLTRKVNALAKDAKATKAN